MKIVILSVTLSGKKLAHKLKSLLSDDPTVIQVDVYHKNIRSNLNKIFNSYDIIVGIMATGIMIRSLLNLLNNKKTDPGILIIDEKSKYVISLIAGHLGGANQISLKISDLLGAEPVITTATDINNKIGIDALAYQFFWEIKNPELIVDFNKAILNGEKIGLLTQSPIDYLFYDSKVADNYYLINKLEYRKIEPIELKDNEIWAVFNDKKILIVPKKLTIGIGSRKDVTRKQVLRAIDQAIQNLKLPISRIDFLATGEMKSNERGIIEAASYLGLPLEIVPLNELREFKSSQCSNSALVKNKFGIVGVCEPSSLISAGKNSKLILKKIPYNKVTVAAAIST